MGKSEYYNVTDIWNAPNQSELHDSHVKHDAELHGFLPAYGSTEQHTGSRNDGHDKLGDSMCRKWPRRR